MVIEFIICDIRLLFSSIFLRLSSVRGEIFVWVFSVLFILHSMLNLFCIFVLLNKFVGVDDITVKDLKKLKNSYSVLYCDYENGGAKKKCEEIPISGHVLNNEIKSLSGKKRHPKEEILGKNILKARRFELYYPLASSFCTVK